MSSRLAIQILLPIEGYDEDKIYEKRDISLSTANLYKKPDDVYYRCLKVKSVYASFGDIKEYVSKKYSLGEMHNVVAMRANYLGGQEVEYEGKQYVVTKEEVKQFEKEHISETVYCNELKYSSLSWFYTSIGPELVPDGIEIIDDNLIQKAADILEYSSKCDLASRLADLIISETDGEDRFMASLVIAKEMAKMINGQAILRYE